DHPSSGNVESGKERCGAVSDVVVGTPLRLSGAHREERWSAIECLYLRLLIHTQNHGLLGRIEIKPDDVAHLLDKQRILRKLEGLGAMRLKREGLPDAMNRGRCEARGLRHRTHAPMCGIARSRFQSSNDHPFDIPIAYRARSSPPTLRHHPRGSAGKTRHSR